MDTVYFLADHVFHLPLVSWEAVAHSNIPFIFRIKSRAHEVLCNAVPAFSATSELTTHTGLPAPLTPDWQPSFPPSPPAVGLSCGTWTLSCSMQDLVPWQGIKLGLPALRVQSLSHQTTGKALFCCCSGPFEYLLFLLPGSFFPLSLLVSQTTHLVLFRSVSSPRPFLMITPFTPLNIGPSPLPAPYSLHSFDHCLFICLPVYCYVPRRQGLGFVHWCFSENTNGARIC